MKTKLVRAVTITLITLFLLGAFMTFPTFATTRIYLNPKDNVYDATTTSVGTKFNVTVMVENAPDMAAWNFFMEFNDSILRVTRWFEPKNDPQYIFAGKTTSPLPYPPDPGYVHLSPGKGRIQVAVSLFPTPPSQPPSSGTGKLCILEFNITAIPTVPGSKLWSNLRIDNSDTYLLDPDGFEVEGVVKENGYYEIQGPPLPPVGSRIFVDPAEIIDPTMIPCVSNFDINIAIDNITSMKKCEFNLTYSSYVISFIGIGFLKVSGQYPIPNIEADDTAGFIWVRLTYNTAITVTNPTPLATITFHVQNLGSTPLNLTDTKIIDPQGTPMPHDVYHGFFAALIRDVAVTNIVLSRTWAYQGWPVNITVTVKNKGNVSETFDVKTFYDSHVIGTITVTNLLPNEERDVTFEWDTTGVAEGNYTIKAEAATVPYEMNTSDNTLVDGQVWIMTQIHDVAIINITLPNSWVFHGYNAKINVTAQNLGVFTETFDIKAYYNSTFLIGTIHVTDLPPSESLEAQFIFNTSELLPCHTYDISAEATQVLYEYDTTNNFLTDGGLKIRWLGDLNGDDKVDVKDVYIVSQAYGSYPGHPRWNPIADINQDLKVDIKDIYIVSRNYGTGCHP
jgi:hypothetical protein